MLKSFVLDQGFEPVTKIDAKNRFITDEKGSISCYWFYEMKRIRDITVKANTGSNVSSCFENVGSMNPQT